MNDLVLVVEWRCDLVLIPLERDQFVVAGGKFRDLFLNRSEFIEVSLDSLLEDLYVLLDALLNLDENLSGLDQGLVVPILEGENVGVDNVLGNGSLMHSHVGDLLEGSYRDWGSLL